MTGAAWFGAALTLALSGCSQEAEARRQAKAEALRQRDLASINNERAVFERDEARARAELAAAERDEARARAEIAKLRAEGANERPEGCP